MGFLFCLQLVLEGPDDILAFEFCPSDPNIIVGGCINGQVLAFTLKQESAVSCAFVVGTRKQIEVNNSPKSSFCHIFRCEVTDCLLLLFQVALWDISDNVTALQAAVKKVSDDSDKFVGIPMLCERVWFLSLGKHLFFFFKHMLFSAVVREMMTCSPQCSFLSAAFN